MEESKGNYEQKKIAIKLGGGGGGGGIGAVVVLGGALATAALAYAFVVGKSGWSSGKDRRRLGGPAPEPSHVDDDPRGEPIESDNDTKLSSTLNENPKSEQISNRTPDMETSEESLSPVTSEKLETYATCNGFVVNEEKNHLFEKKSQNEPHDTLHEDKVTARLSEQVLFDEDCVESEPIDEMTRKVKNREESDEILVDKMIDEVLIDEKESEEKVDKEMDLESRELDEGENANGEEEKCQLPVEILEIVKEDHVCFEIEGHLVKKEHEKCDEKKIVVEKCEDLIEVVNVGEVLVDDAKSENKIDKEMDLEMRELDEGGNANDEVEKCRLDNVCFEIEGQLVKKEHEKCDEKKIVVEKCEDLIDVVVNEGEVLDDDKNDEQACIIFPDLKDTSLLEKVREDMIFSENTEVAKGGLEKDIQEEVDQVELELISPENTAFKKDHQNVNDLEKVIEDEVGFELISLEKSLVEKDHKNDDSEKDIEEEVEFELISPENSKDYKNKDSEKDIEEEVEVELISYESFEMKANRKKDLEEESEEEVEVELISLESIDVKANRKKDPKEVELISHESIEVKANQQKDLETENEKEVEVELISHESIEVAQDHVETNIVAEIKDLPPKTDAKTEDNFVEEISKSKDNSQCPTEDIGIERGREVGGKIQEDKSIEKFDHYPQDSRTESNIVKGFIKYVVDELAMWKDFNFANSTQRIIIILIAVLSVVSSLSCSWFFGLSFAKLCIVVFVTILFSSIVALVE